MYDSSIAFSSEDINLIEQAGLTIEELRDFYERFPDQNLDTAIGGCREEKAHKAENATIPLESSLQETVMESPDSKLPGEVSSAM